MPLLINGSVSNDPWVVIDAENAVEQLNTLDQNAQYILPIAVYLAHREQLDLAPSQLGISLHGDDDLTELFAVLDSVSLVAIDFPVLRDGRGFSIARSISRTGFAGEVRATGDVGFDRLDYMQRSGFNAYQVSDEQYSDEMARAFHEISVNYQPTHPR